MRQYLFALALALGCTFLPTLAPAAETLTEDQAHAIGVDAYLYFYPLVTMELTRQAAYQSAAGTGVARRADESLRQYSPPFHLPT